ncbi:MAG TPA: putative sugar nucleotidyl transferase [Candidatus Eisenbacteria bacterium]|nr:putative sugar nucleotidyl transferase [Candidatus Eisenbacteria bacterium]
MSVALVLFEDARWPDLAPLTDVLPVHALAFGGSNLGTRWMRATRLPLLAVEARTGLWGGWAGGVGVDGVPNAAEGDVLIVNAAALPGPWLDPVLQAPAPALFTCAGRRVAARLPIAQLRPGLGRGAAFEAFLASLDLPAQPVDARVIARPWQLIDWNPQAIADDLSRARVHARGEIHPLAALYRKEHVSVEAGSRVDALAVLDAREGPIHLGANVIVQSHTLVVGPCAVGEGTHLLGGVIGHSTIGPGCRIAGEVDACVWQGWGNKRHHGFVGHSAIGEWANLGALTTTSDLKNNYGTVRVRSGGRELDSGLIKLGAMIGAGVKTGIGTLLPTGAVVGTGSHLFGGGRYAPKHLPAFSWWDGGRTIEYQLDKFTATARIAMSRRGREMLPEQEEALRALFESTAGERREALAAT